MEHEKRVDIVTFMAPVTEHSVSHLIDLTYTALREGSTELHLYISSGGGKLHAAFTAYNYIRSLPATTVTHNIGSVEAAALMLYLACDKRAASPNSRFLPRSLDWTFTHDVVRLGELGEAYEALRFDAKWYADVFRERTGGDFDIDACLEGRTRVLGAEEGLAAGIVTEPDFSAPQVPETAKLWMIHN